MFSICTASSLIFYFAMLLKKCMISCRRKDKCFCFSLFLVCEDMFLRVKQKQFPSAHTHGMMCLLTTHQLTYRPKYLTFHSNKIESIYMGACVRVRVLSGQKPDASAP